MARLQEKMERVRGRMDRFRSRGDWFGPSSSGNRAFDDYRAETLKRLEDEQREFKDFLERLRFAKDRGEFDQFMAARRERPFEPGSQASRRRPSRATEDCRAFPGPPILRMAARFHLLSWTAGWPGQAGLPLARAASAKDGAEIFRLVRTLAENRDSGKRTNIRAIHGSDATRVSSADVDCSVTPVRHVLRPVIIDTISFLSVLVVSRMPICFLSAARKSGRRGGTPDRGCG